MDGARLFNASIAYGVTVRDYAATFDSVWIDLSKGLGCPVGAVLAGRRNSSTAPGGGSTPSAAPCASPDPRRRGIYALQHNIARLAEDHANARLPLKAWQASRRSPRSGMPDTNILFFDTLPPASHRKISSPSSSPPA